MKKVLSLTIATVTLAVLAVLVATTANAQTSAPRTMRARIPFAFHAGSKVLPAGEYRIAVLNPDSDRKALQIRTLDGRASAIVQTFGATVKTIRDSKLVFHRYGDSYFLSEVLVGGMETGRRLAPSRAEKQLRRESEMASNNAQPETVSIALY